MFERKIYTRIDFVVIRFIYSREDWGQEKVREKGGIFVFKKNLYKNSTYLKENRVPHEFFA